MTQLANGLIIQPTFQIRYLTMVFIYNDVGSAISYFYLLETDRLVCHLCLQRRIDCWRRNLQKKKKNPKIDGDQWRWRPMKMENGLPFHFCFFSPLSFFLHIHQLRIWAGGTSIDIMKVWDPQLWLSYLVGFFSLCLFKKKREFM